MDDPDPQFSLAHSDDFSDEEYSVYAILVTPEEKDAVPQTLAILPVNRNTLDINIVNVWGDIMPLGMHAEPQDNEEGIAIESIRDVIIPRMILILSMSITRYNFLDPEGQKEQDLHDMQERLDVDIDELPEAPSFDFDTPEDLFKALENNDKEE